MKKFLLAALAFGAVAALPAASFAATYHYVDTSGTVRTIQADNANDAMLMATDRDPNSGVTLDTGVLDSGDTVTGTGTGSTSANADEYHYVDSSGIVRTVMAPSASVALSAAVNIGMHSGVAQDTGVLDSGVSVTNQ
ncbi:MAG TPA: hypothetical protein VHC20_03810 [Candidatus Paceibacterota bacterium]|nr:hypothetical protein [Candidatus Paceibacterota bacterium]